MSERSRNQHNLSAPPGREHSDRYSSDPYHRQMQEEHKRRADSDDDGWHPPHTGQETPSYSANKPHYQASQDRQQDHEHSRQQSERVRAEDHNHLEENVWLREKHGRITVHDSDLADIHYPKRKNRSAALAGFAGVVAMTGLVVLMAFSSLSELRPDEIIAMDGYAGE